MGVLITLMVIRGKWLGWKKLFRQRRTIVKVVFTVFVNGDYCLYDLNLI